MSNQAFNKQTFNIETELDKAYQYFKNDMNLCRATIDLTPSEFVATLMLDNLVQYETYGFGTRRIVKWLATDTSLYRMETILRKGTVINS